MAKDQIAAEVMEHFARGFAALMQFTGGGPAATVVIQPKALSAEDAATYVGMSRTKFYDIKDEEYAPQKPKIPTTIIEGQPRYLLKHLDAYLKRCEKES